VQGLKSPAPFSYNSAINITNAATPQTKCQGLFNQKAKAEDHLTETLCSLF